MTKPDRRVVIPSRWFLVGALAVGCLLGRSEESVRGEFDAYVKGATQCTVASECVVAWADCPLGCYVVVRADRKEDVEAKARELVSEYQQGGAKCYYDCAAPGELLCVEGRCTDRFVNPSGGAGGAGGGGGSGG